MSVFGVGFWGRFSALERAIFGPPPKRNDLGGPKIPILGLKVPIFGAENADFGVKNANFGVKNPNFGAKNPNFDP